MHKRVRWEDDDESVTAGIEGFDLDSWQLSMIYTSVHIYNGDSRYEQLLCRSSGG